GGQLGPVELDPAALAATGLQLGGAGAAGLRGDPVVDLEQVGRVGVLREGISLGQFAEQVAMALPTTPGGVRVAGDPERLVRTVAVCGGSGGSLLAAAAAAGADVLLTSDVQHHPAVDAAEVPGPALCDVAHYASEWPWLPVAADLLHRDLGGQVQVTVSGRRTDPWTFRVDGRPRR
uniref:Nif3-like dinuclear metal center hexameric protein n=1 Tax=Modestobacter sp. KNN46-3 TaxID=2711218 RepID=UPI0019D1A524